VIEVTGAGCLTGPQVLLPRRNVRRDGSELSSHVEWNCLPVSDSALNETRRSSLVTDSHSMRLRVQPAESSNGRIRVTCALTFACKSGGTSVAISEYNIVKIRAQHDC
jgi:hypothetical protein